MGKAEFKIILEKLNIIYPSCLAKVSYAKDLSPHFCPLFRNR
ncbi:MAG: hypothetical protein QXP36_02990 [Conexivisphaerales archaeon]